MNQRILVSVDTEAPVGTDPVTNMIYGKVGNDLFGIDFLMDFFDERKIKALFFVDFAEAWDYGKDKIANVVRHINMRGHDVGVHLHPDHMMDCKRRFLWEYSFEEQYEMISKCTSLYKEILGTSPLSFRAGRYGANNDTLLVLQQLGYRYDMSEFYGSRYCKISPPVSWNQMVKIPDSQLIEVPVTTFKSFSTFFYTRNDQLDSGMLPCEFRRVVKKMNRTNTVDIASMFVHSFQFLDWRIDPDNPVFNKRKYRYFQRNFDTLTKHGCVFIQEKDLLEIMTTQYESDMSLDLSKGIMPLIYFVIRALKVLKDRIENNV